MKYLLLTFLLIASSAQAYILPVRNIIQKTSENAGNGVYSIEQEVQFQNGGEILSVKENWIIENDRTMRLTVTGTKDLQNSFRMQFVYNGGQRTEMNGNSRSSRRLTDDFLERYFNFRNPENLNSALVSMKLIPATAYTKRQVAGKGGEFKYEAEPYVRLSRVGGVATYAFGEAIAPDTDAKTPGMWIEQDQFLIRKVRVSSQAEVVADNYTQFAKGLSYPRMRTIHWGNQSVTVRLISATARAGNSSSLFQASSLDTPIRTEGLNNLPAREAILEFYSRFR